LSPPPITSRKNQRLRTARALATRRGRRRLERFLLEGPKAVAEALERGPDRVEQLLYAAGAERSAAVAALLERAAAAGVPAFAVEPALYDEVAPATSPQPALAVARVAWTPLAELLRGPVPGAPRAVVACCGVQDPGNVGTILRTARFFGVAGAAFVGGGDPWAPKVVRASAGALLARPPARAADGAALLEAARAAGLAPVALVPEGGAPPGPGVLGRRVLLLLGAEGTGLPAELAAAARPATIARRDPGAESLNVAVAFAVVADRWAEGVSGER